MISARCQRLSDRRARLGESPVYSPAEDCVWWIDIKGRKLLRTEARSGSTQEWPTPGPIGFVALWRDGELVTGIGGNLFAFDRTSGTFTGLASVDEREGIRFNDAATDPEGRLWAVTMDMDNRRKIGCLYCIAPDLTSRAVFEGLITPNGVAVDGGRGRLYVSDSHPSVQTIWHADLEAGSGAVGKRAVFASTHALPGRPDGAAIDDQGNYWIAGVDGGEIYCFAPSGHLIERVPLPLAYPTKIAFIPDAPGQAWLTSKAGDAADDLSGFLARCALTVSAGTGEV